MERMGDSPPHKLQRYQLVKFNCWRENNSEYTLPADGQNMTKIKITLEIPCVYDFYCQYLFENQDIRGLYNVYDLWFIKKSTKLKKVLN